MNEHRHAEIEQARIRWHDHQFEHDCYARTAVRTAGSTAPASMPSAVLGLNRDPQPGRRPHKPVLDDGHARTHPPATASAAATKDPPAAQNGGSVRGFGPKAGYVL